MLSLAIIAKDEKQQVERIVKEYGKFFDEVVVAADVEMEVEGATILNYELSDEEKEFGGIFFDRKRNWLAEKVNGEYYFRMDTDDDLVGGENISKVYKKAKKLGVDVLYCYYDYGRDEWGNTHAAHYRETIIRKTTDIYWNKHIHENIIPIDGYKQKIAEENSIKVIHNIDKDENRVERNLKYLIYEYNQDPKNCDPRTLAYLGRMFTTIDADKAKYFLEQHIQKSGWDEDRVLSWIYLAEVYLQEKDYDRAVSCCTEAILDRPDYPDGYLKLHEVYTHMGEWKKAIRWGETGLRVEAPKTLMVRDPAGRTWRPCLTMAIALFNLNRVEEAMAFLQKAKEFVPDYEPILENERIFQEAIDTNNFIQSFKKVYDYIAQHNTAECKNLVDMVPKKLMKQPYFADRILAHTYTKTWSEDEIAIFCGRSPDEWCPLSINKGIGGSEEAVIQVSKELQNLGKRVTVFCECGELEGEYGGVVYKDTIRFNPKDNFNVLIAWRGNFFDIAELKAKKKILWLHDMPQPDQFTACNFDHVIVLSEYHKSLLPDCVPEEKIFVSTNGLVPKDFASLKVDRKRGRIIYASSYDRGLEFLLDNWSKVREKVPYAELHIFYGWNTYDKLARMGYRDGTYKDMMVEKMQQEGIFEHGRVGHKKLLKEYCKSEVFAYPSDFAGEINCIALSKAIACGCKTVTNDFAVLPERNSGLVATNETFIDSLIDVLGKENKSGINKKYINKMAWDNVAKSWLTIIGTHELNNYTSDVFDNYTVSVP